MKLSIQRWSGLFVMVLALLLATSSVTFAQPNQRTYAVTIHNLTAHQAFTPPLLATHHRKTMFFEVGQPAGVGIQQIAENGNLDPMLEALANDTDVSAVVVAAGNPPPLPGGQSITVQITGESRAKYLSMAMMLICTNDGFTGVDSVRLPQHIGDSSSIYANAYDAGTEINTEDFADIVPPCPALSGVTSDVPGTGMSNPALAEHGVIMHHNSIQGGADLQTAVHGWSDPVAMITITRIN